MIEQAVMAEYKKVTAEADTSSSSQIEIIGAQGVHIQDLTRCRVYLLFRLRQHGNRPE
jgi:hypothetical protein